MENILRLAKLFIFNITVVLGRIEEVDSEINYIPYMVEIINTKRNVKMSHKIMINKIFVNEDDSIKILNNNHFIDKILIDYIHTSDRVFKDKFEETFNKDEIELLLENFNPFPSFKYIECIRC